MNTLLSKLAQIEASKSNYANTEATELLHSVVKEADFKDANSEILQDLLEFGIDAIVEEKFFNTHKGYTNERAIDLACEKLGADFSTDELVDLNYAIANYVPYGEGEVIESYDLTDSGIAYALEQICEEPDWVKIGSFYVRIAY